MYKEIIMKKANEENNLLYVLYLFTTASHSHFETVTSKDTEAYCQSSVIPPPKKVRTQIAKAKSCRAVKD